MCSNRAGALVLALLCSYLCASEQTTSTANVTTKVVSRGRAPVGKFGYWYMRPVKLSGSKGQLLTVPKPRAISFLRMRDTLLEQVDSILLLDTTFALETGPGSYLYKRKAFWTSGDIDSDGSDEVIVALDTLVLVYRWNGTTFVPETMTLPRAARQLVVGDIDNDGRNELIAACDTTTKGRWREDVAGMRYCIYVCRLVGKKLEVMWSDGAKLGYGEPIMPDYFWSVADFQNFGRSQLLVTRSQSDVRPTIYDLLEWNGNDKGLSRQASFIVSDTLVPAASNASYIFPHALGRMQPFSTDLGTLVIVEFKDLDTADSGDLDVAFRQRLVRMAGGDMQSLGDVRDLDHPSMGDYDAALDPDGSGTGIIRIWRTGPQDCFFEFRRVLVNRQQPSTQR